MLITKDSVVHIYTDKEGNIKIIWNQNPLDFLSWIELSYPTEIDYALYQPACLIKTVTQHPSYMNSEIKNWGDTMAYVKNGPINNTIVMRYIFTGESKVEVVRCVLMNEMNKKIKL